MKLKCNKSVARFCCGL